MILTCPECSTRYQADPAKFPPQGRDVRCAKCGHVWHQRAPESEPEPEPVIAEPPEPEARAFEPEVRREDFAPTPRVETNDAERGTGPSPWPRRAALGAGWAGLAAIVLLIGSAAALYRKDIVSAWPRSASLYATLGVKTDAGGFAFRDLHYHLENQGGEPVLSVSGVVVNTTKGELPVGEIRVGLSDRDNREIYHWTFSPDATTLGAGQSMPFTTRLSSPPADAKHLAVRFARAGD